MTVKDDCGYNAWRIAVKCREKSMVELLINFHIKNPGLVHSSHSFPALTVDDLMLLIYGKFTKLSLLMDQKIQKLDPA